MIHILKARWYVVLYNLGYLIAQDIREADHVCIGPVSYEAARQYIEGCTR